MYVLLQLLSEQANMLLEKRWEEMIGQTQSSVWDWVCVLSPAVRMLATGTSTSSLAVLGSGATGFTT